MLVAVIGAALSRYFDRRQQIEQEQRQRKAEVYEMFLEYWYWAMSERSKASENDKKKRLLEYRRKVPQKLAVWGSESFIKEYGVWFQSNETQGSIFEFEKIIRTIRADLDLLKLSNKGVDEYLRELQAASDTKVAPK